MTAALLSLSPCALEPDHLSLLTRFERVRSELLRVLMLPTRDHGCPADSCAEILVTAIVFGGARPALAKAIISALSDHVVKDGDTLWVDLPSDKGPLKRWVADCVTGNAILAATERHGADLTGDEQAAWVSAGKFAKSILTACGVKNLAKPLDELTRLAGAWRSQHLPGHLAAFSNGNLTSVPLPLATLARKYGAIDLPQPPARTHKSFEFHGLHRQEAVAQLKTLLESALADQGKAKGSRSRSVDKAAIHRQIEFLGKIEEPGLARLGIQWLAKMLRNGGKRKAKLAESTITTYFTTFKRLVASLALRPITTIMEEELEQLYRDLLVDTPTQSRQRAYACLRALHEVGEAEIGLPDVEWLPIIRGLDLGTPTVDANIVYQREVDQALALLDAASASDPLHAPLAALCLGLMWCSKARIGEAWRLRVGDVLNEYLLIRNTAHGTTKSSAGVRTVPRTGTAWDDLNARLELALERARGLCDDPRTPLLCSPEKPTEPVSRRRIEELIGWALRTATGDPTVRTHHLRHSRATLTFEAVVWQGYESRSWMEGAPLRQAMLGEVDPTRRALQAVALCTGHAHPETTLGVYVHGLEFHLASALDACLERLPLEDVARLGRLRPNRVRKLSAGGRDTVAMLRHAMARHLAQQTNLDLQSRFSPRTALPEAVLTAPQAPSGPSLLELRSALLMKQDLALSMDAIAYRTGVSPSHVVELDNVAAHLRRTCGLVLIQSPDEGAFHGSPETRLVGSGRRQFLRRAFETAEALDAKQPFASDAATVCRAYSQSTRSLSLNTASDVASAIRGLMGMGLQPGEIVLSCPGEPAALRAELERFAPGTSRVTIDIASSRVQPEDRKRSRTRTYRIRIRHDERYMHLRGVVEAIAMWLVRYNLEQHPDETA